jgi:hypothetical protein
MAFVVPAVSNAGVDGSKLCAQLCRASSATLESFSTA